MELLFPPLSGGQAQGLNDAGVETFQGSVDVHLARECGQNSGDAKRPDVDTARLEFARVDLKPEQIPAFSSLREALVACLAHWKNKDKERKFFEEALRLAERPLIPVLRIRDSGTVGLTGSDTDQTGRWYALVKSQGLSNKEDTAGGSFGIGKSSPFAASRFRTVFYGTRLEDGAVALQGVSRLVTHRGKDRRLTQGTGFIGLYDPLGGEEGDPVFRAVRDAGAIPQVFARDDQGSDIWVIGYRSGAEWADELTKSILSNFWPAVHHGQLAFRVGTQDITRENLAELIERYAGQPEFDAHHYYNAILTQPIRRTLQHTGSCELYLTTGSAELPKRICMVRGNGMRIFEYAPKSCRVPFAGLFICRDTEGNKLLRQMEPPRHDKWDEKRIEGPLGKRALSEIKEWIRDEVKKLNPFFTGKSFNESELAKYVPDDLEPETSEGLDWTADTAEESLEPTPRLGDVKIKVTPVHPPARLPGDEPEQAGGQGESGIQAGGGMGDGRGGGGVGARGGSQERQTRPVRLHLRAYACGDDGTYAVVLRSDADFTGSVTLTAMGEDGSREPVLIKRVTAEGSSDVVACDANRIHGLTLSAGVPLRLTVALDAAAPRSLVAVGAA